MSEDKEEPRVIICGNCGTEIPLTVAPLPRANPRYSTLEAAINAGQVAFAFTMSADVLGQLQTALAVRKLRAHLTLVEYFARKCVEGLATPLEALQAIRETARPFIDPLTDDQVVVLPKEEPK